MFQQKNAVCIRCLLVTGFLTAAIGVCACRDLAHVNYQPVTSIVDNDKIRLLNRDGHKLDRTDPKFQWSQAAEIELFEKKLDTPVLIEKRILSELRPFIVKEDPPHLKITTAGESVTIYGWRAVKLADDTILVSGGRLQDSKMKFSCVSSTWIIDPKSNVVSKFQNLNTPRSDHTITLLKDNRILVTGGISSDYTVLSSCEIYDGQNKGFTNGGKLCMPRYNHAATQLSSGKVLVVGGTTDSNLSDQDYSMTTQIELIDVNERKTGIIGRLSNAREKPQLIPFDKKSVLIIGGDGIGSLPIAVDEILVVED